jgi:hypothetical protein
MKKEPFFVGKVQFKACTGFPDTEDSLSDNGKASMSKQMIKPITPFQAKCDQKKPPAVPAMLEPE